MYIENTSYDPSSLSSTEKDEMIRVLQYLDGFIATLEAQTNDAEEREGVKKYGEMTWRSVSAYIKDKIGTTAGEVVKEFKLVMPGVIPVSLMVTKNDLKNAIKEVNGTDFIETLKFAIDMMVLAPSCDYKLHGLAAATVLSFLSSIIRVDRGIPSMFAYTVYTDPLDVIWAKEKVYPASIIDYSSIKNSKIHDTSYNPGFAFKFNFCAYYTQMSTTTAHIVRGSDPILRDIIDDITVKLSHFMFKQSKKDAQ